MKYEVLRDCYTGERFYRKGDFYELPDDMLKFEKNFKLVDGQAEPLPEQAIEVVEEVTSAIPPEPAKEAELPIKTKTKRERKSHRK
jgi:hypothetical protein